MPVSKLPKGNDLTARILSFLAANDDRLRHFLDITGLTPVTVRLVADSPAFADALIEHILEDDFRVLAFAAFCEVPPEAVAKLRRPLRVVPAATKPRSAPGQSEIARRYGKSE